MAAEYYRTLTVRSKDEGLDATAAKLRKVGNEAKQAGEGVKKFGADSTQGARRLGDLDRQLANLDKQLAGAPAAFSNFERNARLLQRGFEAGKVSAQDFSRQMGELQARLQKSVAPRLGMDVDASGLRRLIDGQVELDAATRRSIMTLVSQQEHVERAMNAAAMDVAAFGHELERLRSKYNPLYAASKQYETELDELNRALSIGAVTAQQHAEALDGLNARYTAAATSANASNTAWSKTAGVIGAANDNIALTGPQIQNLGYQLNDVATMLLMGASPFQIMASQGGQVVQALGMGPGGVRGSLQALGTAVMSVITPARLIAAGLLAAGAAAVYFTSRGHDGAKKAEDALSSYDSVLGRVEKSFDRLSQAARTVFDRDLVGSAALNQARLMSAVREQQEAARAVAGDILRQATPNDGLVPNPLASGAELLRMLSSSEYRNVRTELLQIATGLQDGSLRASELQERLAEISQSETLPSDLTDLVDQLLKASEAARDAEARIQALTRAHAELMRQNREDAFFDMRKSLGAFIEDTRTAQQKIEDTYALATMGPTLLSSAEIEEAGRLRQQALDQIAAKEQVIRDGHKLDLQAITARTAEEKAAIAAERTRLNLSGEAISEAEKALRVEEARTLSLRQSAHEASEALRQRIEAERDSVAQMELDISLIGKSAGEVARLSMEYDLLRAAKQAAYEAGTTLGNDEIERIRKHAAEVGRLANEYAQLQALSDISFERSLIGLSDGDQHILSYLRQIGVEANSSQGQMIGGQMRYNQVLQETQDELQAMHDIGKEAFMSILDILYETGDIGDKLIGIFAQLGKQFAQMGMEKLWKSISGEGKSIFDGAMGAVASWPEMAGGGRGFAQLQTATSRMETSVQRMSDTMSVASNDLAGNIKRAANLLGTSAHDLATVISFETGGTFSTSIRGGAGNRHIGLIQFGPEEQRRYGAAIGQTLTDQMDAVVRYLKDRGFKPGMTGAELYATINTGSPRTGHRSDAANGGTWGSAIDKWNHQMGGHRANADRILGKQAVSDGMIDATRKIAHMPEMAGNGPMGHIPTPQQGAGMFGGMNMNTMMAGVGAFAGGMQSGDPLGGAIGGGLGMLGAGAGPLGIAAGAVLGLVGGLIGKAKQKKEELKKARQELEQQMGAITDLIARATGNFMGSYQSQLMQISDEFAKAIALAEKAKNTKLVKELNDAQDEFFDNMADRWQRNFDGMIASMEAGMGLDSAYMAGMDAVEKMRETLVGFVNDAKMFSEAGDDLAGWLTDLKGIVKDSGLLNRYMDGITDLPEFFSGGINVSQDMKDAVERWKTEIEKFGIKVFNEGTAPTQSDAGTPITAVYETVDGLRDKLRDLGVEFNEQGEILRAAADANGAYADQVEQARQAAIKTALAAISGADEFTAMEEAVDKAQGAAKNMASLLDDLGVSAEEAARAIESHLNIAMAKMRDAYRDELNASINDKSGFGFINEIVDAHKLYEDRLRDATKLGLDGSLAMKELNLSLQNIVSSSSLTQAEIDMLAAAWPAMAGLIEAVAGKDAMAMVAEAESALRAAYEKQKSEIETTISRLERFTDTIKRFREEMRVNATSPLSQKQQMEEALKLYRETAAAAMSGDQEAQEKLTSVSQSALDEARAYYASSEEYAKIWREIDTTLELVERSAGRQLSEAQQQLEALNKQVGALIDINESVLSVEEAIAALANATSARDRQMQEQIDAAKNSGVESKNAQIAEMYRSILGREGRADEIDWWANKSGKSIAQIRADIEFAKLHGAMRLGGIVGAYANGGIVGNGLYDVDSVLAKYAGGGSIALAGGEHVTRAPSVNAATMPILDHINATGRPPQNDNSALVAEIRELRLELAELKGVTAATGQQTADAIERGNKNTNEMKSALRKVASAAA